MADVCKSQTNCLNNAKRIIAGGYLYLYLIKLPGITSSRAVSACGLVTCSCFLEGKSLTLYEEIRLNTWNDYNSLQGMVGRQRIPLFLRAWL